METTKIETNSTFIFKKVANMYAYLLNRLGYKATIDEIVWKSIGKSQSVYIVGGEKVIKKREPWKPWQASINLEKGRNQDCISTKGCCPHHSNTRKQERWKLRRVFE